MVGDNGDSCGLLPVCLYVSVGGCVCTCASERIFVRECACVVVDENVSVLMRGCEPVRASILEEGKACK